ncbi:MAG: hypothetical protein Q4G28_06680 [Neisseria sp.]|nr:hypothetical protein [Neisseria sp.]
MPNRFRFFSLLALLTALPACSAVPAGLSLVREHYPLGENASAGIARYCAAPDEAVLLYLPHENETTAARAALADISAQGRGCLLALEQHGRRRISFEADGRPADFDPNRIYTAAGRAATLARSGNRSAAAEQITAEFADYLLAQYLGRARFIIAVHNNTDGATDIRSYLDGGYGSADVFVNPARDPDDYLFVIDAAAFRYFSGRGFNVVLQDNQAVKDDGSLSVYAARHGIAYINVEAQYGHLDEQGEMLRAVRDYSEIK